MKINMTNKTDWRPHISTLAEVMADRGYTVSNIDPAKKNLEDFIQQIIDQQVTIAVEEESKRILELPVMKMEDLGGHYYEEKIVIEAKNELRQQIKDLLNK
jgi:hypothetical protein